LVLVLVATIGGELVGDQMVQEVGRKWGKKVAVGGWDVAVGRRCRLVGFSNGWQGFEAGLGG
jgi:hypothetical protein